MLAGLRRKPGNAAAKREYGKWKVIGSNLLYLDYKEMEEEDIEEALRRFGDRSTIKFWDQHSMCLPNEECGCDEPEEEDDEQYMMKTKRHTWRPPRIISRVCRVMVSCLSVKISLFLDCSGGRIAFKC